MWSTATALAANVANAQRLDLDVAPLSTLPRLPDIDTLEDLRRWCSQAQQRQLEEQQQTEGQQQSGSGAADSGSLLSVALQVAGLAAPSQDDLLCTSKIHSPNA